MNQVLGAQMEETLKQFQRLSTSYYNTVMDYHFGLTKLQMLENILILWPTKVAKKTLDKIFSDDDLERRRCSNSWSSRPPNDAADHGLLVFEFVHSFQHVRDGELADGEAVDGKERVHGRPGLPNPR